MTKFEEFEHIIAKLRAPDGCPWDREQTHASLKNAVFIMVDSSDIDMSKYKTFIAE